MIKIIGHAVNLALLTLALYFVVDAGYDQLRFRVSAPSTAYRTAQDAPGAMARQHHPFAYFQPIVTRDLFHTKASAAEKSESRPAAVDIEKLEKTELRLKLWGTVAGGNDGSYAVIESEKEKKQHLYHIGDTLEGATVKLILREKVILTVNGKDEVLEIENPTSAGGLKRPLAGLSPSITGGKSSPRISRRRITLRRAQIDSAMSDISQLMGEAKIEPVKTVDGDQGLVITRIKPNSLFRRMGLRNGDIIKQVDGNTITTVDDALRLYGNLKTSDSVSVSIKRRGRDQLIDYRIR